ncbi:hypothetical protein, partial [Paenibacillus koleovorans]|uniref:hypothetical protein n=1 Tax=Paenibacillus koleovorans TaxID=121608 RepID=UPI001C3FBF72
MIKTAKNVIISGILLSRFRLMNRMILIAGRSLFLSIYFATKNKTVEVGQNTLRMKMGLSSKSF